MKKNKKPQGEKPNPKKQYLTDRKAELDKCGTVAELREFLKIWY